jgi:hypothetical protein
VDCNPKESHLVIRFIWFLSQSATWINMRDQYRPLNTSVCRLHDTSASGCKCTRFCELFGVHAAGVAQWTCVFLTRQCFELHQTSIGPLFRDDKEREKKEIAKERKAERTKDSVWALLNTFPFLFQPKAQLIGAVCQNVTIRTFFKDFDQLDFDIFWPTKNVSLVADLEPSLLPFPHAEPISHWTPQESPRSPVKRSPKRKRSRRSKRKAGPKGWTYRIFFSQILYKIDWNNII